MKFYIETYGCTMNQGEARMMAEQLEGRGWIRESTPENADMLMVVTCTVIGATERKILKRLSNLNVLAKPMIVAGCMAEIQKDRIWDVAPNSQLLGVHDISSNLDKILGIIPDISEIREESPIRKTNDHIIGIVPIAQGCLGNCAYCITKFARGELSSYPIEKIMNDVKNELEKGAKEIRLTAMDTGCYGHDINSNLADLVNQICKIKREFRIRIGMTNPENVKPILNEIIEAYRNDKVYKFLHLPVQSGNDEMLKKMNRKYAVDDFVQIVNVFRAKFDDILLSTDIIVGFPGESEEAFIDSYNLVENVKPDIVNITRFSPRPGTAAEKMQDQIVGWKVKERSRKLNALRSIITFDNNERFVGRSEKVLTVEYGKNNTTVGRTNAYRPVVLIEEPNLGELLNVEIVENGGIFLIAKKK